MRRGARSPRRAGPVGLAETNSSRIRSGARAPPPPNESPAASAAAQRVAVPSVGQGQVEEARAGDLVADERVGERRRQRVPRAPRRSRAASCRAAARATSRHWSRSRPDRRALGARDSARDAGWGSRRSQLASPRAPPLAARQPDRLGRGRSLARRGDRLELALEPLERLSGSKRDQRVAGIDDGFR